ncbi:3-keto-5-aminohexanoate cleavage protein [Nonomuraea sp. 10N515B]|uniref:3-keto-5-aminohexanoate cleavage protein n=1 Tax=Nonomuraea sp. 10N515B TaxID=3457422 RepID=UPI003FCC3DD8
MKTWTVWPDVVSANFFEAGVLELCELVLARGIAIEAAMLSVDDAHAFVSSGMAARCSWVLLEAFEERAEDALRAVSAMETVLSEADVQLERVYHGYGPASWAVQRYGAARGHGVRAGLEDVTVLPDGRPASGNGEIVAAAAALMAHAAL